MKGLKKTIILALLISQAIVLSMLESLVPIPVGIPGVKLGLANVVTLVAIEFFCFSDAAIVVVVRCLLMSLLAGGPVAFLFSVVGGMSSAAVMAFMRREMHNLFSMQGISVAGAVVHNIGQIAVAGMMMKEVSVVAYLPVLLLSGIITGYLVGIGADFLVKALCRINLFRSK